MKHCKTFTHYIDPENFRYNSEDKSVEVDCYVENGEVTITHIKLTPDQIHCLESITTLSNDVAEEADALFLEPIVAVKSIPSYSNAI